MRTGGGGGRRGKGWYLGRAFDEPGGPPVPSSPLQEETVHVHTLLWMCDVWWCVVCVVCDVWWCV